MLGRAPTFTGLDSPVPSRGCSGGGDCAKSSGACVRVPVRSGPGCRLASAVKSQLLLGPCAIRPGGRLVPAQPSSGRLPGPDQAPCGQADRPAWRLSTRPTLSAHARTSRQPCVELPARKALRGNRAITQSSEAASARPRRRAGNPGLVRGRAIQVLDLCWGRRCHPAQIGAQNGKFVRHSRTLTTRTASAG